MKLPSSIRARFSQENHNRFDDLKNVWAQNAKSLKPRSWELLWIGVLLILLGSIFSQIVTHFLIPELPPPEFTQNIILEKITYIEPESQLLNFAADYNGGKIIPQLSSPEYHGVLSSFSNNNRESVLNQRQKPGDCWAFGGQQGRVAIQLGAQIIPEKFSLYYLNKIEYSTAPKEYQVFNLQEENRPLLLGRYVYNIKIEGQTRNNTRAVENCQQNCGIPLKRVLLRINSNYGAENTCVYHFGVHGTQFNKFNYKG